MLKNVFKVRTDGCATQPNRERTDQPKSPNHVAWTRADLSGSFFFCQPMRFYHFFLALKLDGEVVYVLLSWRRGVKTECLHDFSLGGGVAIILSWLFMKGLDPNDTQ